MKKYTPHMLLIDLLYYVAHEHAKGTDHTVILATVLHDLNTYKKDRNRPWYCPRVAGFKDKAI
jgi:hypothetical protein